MKSTYNKRPNKFMSSPKGKAKQFNRVQDKVRDPENVIVPRKMPLHPQHVELVPSITFKRRFLASGGAVSGNFIIADGNLQFLVATASTVLQNWVKDWRIKKIAIWAPCGTAGTAGYCSIQCSANDSANNLRNDRSITVGDTTTSQDVPARCCVHPLVTSVLGSWHSCNNVNTSQILCQLTCSQGATVDITFEVTPNFDAVPTNYTSSTVGATNGQLYARVPITNLSPFGINSI